MKDRTILNLETFSDRASIHRRQKPPDLKGEIEKSAIIVVGFNVPLSVNNGQTNRNKSIGIEKF